MHSEILNFRKNSKSTSFSFENGDFTVLKHFQRLTVSPKIDQFGRKRCQKKRKDVSHQLLWQLLQKYFVVHERSAVKNSFSTYIWSKVDSCFCEAVYVPNTQVNVLAHVAENGGIIQTVLLFLSFLLRKRQEAFHGHFHVPCIENQEKSDFPLIYISCTFSWLLFLLRTLIQIDP